MNAWSDFKRRMVSALQDCLVTRKPPRLPDGGAALWRWFTDLSRIRSYHMSGPNAVSHVEIEAYCHLHRITMQPHHVAILRAMDDAYLDHIASMRDRPDDIKVLPHRASGEINASLFDAVFG